MEYTVKKLAKLSGVSSRTLRYYDEIGLLKPARINSNGYRIYGQKEVDLLQQILFYRELDFDLESIKQIVTNPNFNQKEALMSHYERLKAKRNRLEKIMNTLEKTMKSLEGGKQMNDQEKFEGLKDKLIEENERRFGKEIREKYGEEAVNKSNEKLKNMTEDQYKKMTELGEEVLILLKKAYETGDPTSEEARNLAEKHKEWLHFSWPHYSKEAHANLADMYVQDERFTAYYDKVVKGGTIFLRDAIYHYLGLKR